METFDKAKQGKAGCISNIERQAAHPISAKYSFSMQENGTRDMDS